jgi:hypothetical protein
MTYAQQISKPLKHQHPDSPSEKSSKNGSSEGKVGVNLKGIRSLMEIKTLREQFKFMIEKIENNSCTVVTVKEAPKQPIDLK